MMELTGDMPVTLVIKAPNQRLQDQTVDCMLGWTIRKLKNHLETVYPSKPKHNEQRLIYSGRLLQDHLTLKEILRQFDSSDDSNTHTVHLVCSTSADSTPPASSTGNPAANVTEAAQHQNAVPQSDGLRHRVVNEMNNGATYNPASTEAYGQHVFQSYGYNTNPGMAAGGYTPEQYAWMMQQQQLYSQYMMQYSQYYQSMYYPNQSFNQQVPNVFQQQFQQGFPQMYQQVPQHQAQQPAAGNNQPAAPAAARQNVRMNAQGGMEEDDDDDGEPRDWLHHSYFIMRVLTFMGILFFYSSITRFLIVFSGSFGIYILQKLRKYMQRNQREQEQRQDQPAEQVAAPAEQEAAAADPVAQAAPVVQEPGTEDTPHTPGSAENDADSQPTGVVPEEEQQQQQDEGHVSRMFIFAWKTVQAFFTSLLPAPPELLEAN